MKLSQETTNSLDAKLNPVIIYMSSGASCIMAQIQLNAFINEVNAQTGTNITSAQAGTLISAAQNIINSFAC